MRGVGGGDALEIEVGLEAGGSFKKWLNSDDIAIVNKQIAVMTTRLARGTAAIPLELIISVSRIRICVPHGST